MEGAGQEFRACSAAFEKLTASLRILCQIHAASCPGRETRVTHRGALPSALHLGSSRGDPREISEGRGLLPSGPRTVLGAPCRWSRLLASPLGPGVLGRGKRFAVGVRSPPSLPPWFPYCLAPQLAMAGFVTLIQSTLTTFATRQSYLQQTTLRENVKYSHVGQNCSFRDGDSDDESFLEGAPGTDVSLPPPS